MRKSMSTGNSDRGGDDRPSVPQRSEDPVELGVGGALNDVRSGTVGQSIVESLTDRIEFEASAFDSVLEEVLPNREW